MKRVVFAALATLVAVGTIAPFICCNPPLMSGVRADETCPLQRTECEATGVFQQIAAPPQPPPGSKSFLIIRSMSATLPASAGTLPWRTTVDFNQGKQHTTPVQLRI